MPMVEGIVPVRAFPERSLGSELLESRKRNAQRGERDQVTNAGRDCPVERIVLEGPA